MSRDLLYTLRWLINHPGRENKAEALKIIGSLLGESPGESVRNLPTPAAPAPSHSGPRGRVALVIGHNSRSKGAYVKGRFNQFEYDFNGELASLIQSRAWAGLELKTFRRVYSGSYTSEIATVYNKVNAWNPDFILELHFNSYKGGDYSFMLYHHASAKSKAIAQTVNDVFCAATGFKSNQKNAGRKSGQRGYVSLAKSKAPCVLTEPFFENNPTHLRKIESLGHSGVAELYLTAIRKVLS